MKYIAVIIILIIALLTALHYKREGFNFWKTFILMIIMQFGLLLLVIGLF